ncbi:MAG: class II aldolase/adducin family protein [Acidimicrobiia bacterium]|nr:class II aldolase/adducin family protein [Acidimicrobiia bacterium]
MKVGHARDDRPLPQELLDDPRLTSLAKWGKRLAESGLSPDASGNMSCRTPGGFLITRTGVPLAAIERDDWVLVSGIDRDSVGSVVVMSRGPHEPSRDAAAHASLYGRRPEAATVFHLHVGLLEELSGRLGVPSTDTHYPAGTKESMEEIERFLDAHLETRYFVLVDHGIIAWGESIDETGALVETYQLEVDQGG